jgi:hypothetical protein
LFSKSRMRRRRTDHLELKGKCFGLIFEKALFFNRTILNNMLQCIQICFLSSRGDGPYLNLVLNVELYPSLHRQTERFMHYDWQIQDSRLLNNQSIIIIIVTLFTHMRNADYYSHLFSM